MPPPLFARKSLWKEGAGDKADTIPTVHNACSKKAMAGEGQRSHCKERFHGSDIWTNPGREVCIQSTKAAR